MLTISLEELCRYTAAIPTTRNMRGGQQVMNSVVTDKTSVNIELYALCLHTSSITSDPLKHSNLMNYSYVNIRVCPRHRHIVPGLLTVATEV